MAAITVNAIELGKDAKILLVQMGAVITMGDAVYKDTSDSKWKLATATGTAAQAGQDGIGIALHDVSADGRWGVIVTKGTVYIDTLDAGVGTTGEADTYIVGGSAAGTIAPIADLAASWFSTILGTGGTEGSSDAVDEFIMQPIISNHEF